MSDRSQSSLADVHTQVAHRVRENLTASSETFLPLSVYRELPVDGDTIRLLLVKPASDLAAHIKCTLTDVRLLRNSATLDDGIETSYQVQYEALSYEWGDPFPTQLIHINGQPVQIRENLYHWLKRARYSHRTRAL